MSKQFVLQGSAKDKVLKIDYQKELNQEQLDIVLHGDGACLVLAGAGSGKTRTVTYRVAYLLEQGIQPSEMLLLTFTNKASREMRERVERLLGSSIDGIWSGTFHSIANRLLRTYADRIGFERSFTILDREDAKSMMKLVLKEMRIDPKARRFPSASVCLDIDSYTRNVCGSVMGTLELKYPHFEELEPELVEIVSRYEDRKRRSNAMDFDDLLMYLLMLLEDPDIGPHIAQRFRYVLVDEYQDTNAIQARIVQRFSSVHQNVFVVGDDAQSIYGFRGADIQNILNFPYEYSEAKTFKLLTNYRSTPQILYVANEALSHNVDQFQKELVGLREAGDKPSLVPAASARQEAQYIAEQILQLRSDGTAFENIAVLFRATSHSQQLELELIKRDIPYEYRGGKKLFERAHIKDVLAFLRIAHNPKDEQAWMRLLEMQKGIGAVGAERLTSELILLSQLEGLEGNAFSHLKPKMKPGWDRLCAIIEKYLTVKESPSEMIRAIAASSYQNDLEREYPNWRDRLEDIEQFALFAESYDDLSSFLSDVLLYDDVAALRESGGERDDERIVLSTIHQAKGLEWHTVFIMHLADGFFPNKRALAEDGGVEEERRLFYVAVTRARERLFLTYPLTSGMESLMLNRPSQFLDEVSPSLFERIELVHASPKRDILRPVGDGWSWDGSDASAFSDDEVIELDEYGDRKPRTSSGTGTVWKSRDKGV